MSDGDGMVFSGMFRSVMLELRPSKGRIDRKVEECIVPGAWRNPV